VPAGSLLFDYLNTVKTARSALALSEVQPAHEITKTLASGAMSHGALIGEAHEAVAQGTNIVGALSNSGEGGEHFSRFNSIKSSKIKSGLTVSSLSNAFFPPVAKVVS
jgi:glutamate synthase (NADPH/NADH) large chain